MNGGDDDPLLGSEGGEGAKGSPKISDREIEIPSEEDGTGVTAAFVQMLQGNLGPGILTLPFVFTLGGVIVTSIMTISVMLATLYAMFLVLRSKQWLHRSEEFLIVPEQDRPQTFQRVGRELLGNVGEKIIVVFVVLMQLGICTVFLNYASENLIAVERYYMSDNATCLEPDDDDRDFVSDEMIIGNGTAGNGTPGGNGTLPICNILNLTVDKTYMIFALTPIVLGLSTTRGSLIITISTTLATLIMYVGLGTILYLVGLHFWKYYHGIKPIAEKNWAGVQVWPEHNIDLPIVFGNLVYTVTTAVGILLPIENSMKLSARRKFPQVLMAAMLGALALFMLVGALANFAFGKQTEPSITAAFVQAEIGEPTFISVINCMLAVSVILTYPLQFRPAANVIERAVGVDAEDSRSSTSQTLQSAAIPLRSWWRSRGYIPVRFFLIILTAGLAASVPKLDLVVSFAGSFTSCVLAMMIPPAMDFAVMKREGRYPVGRMVMNSVLVFIGVVGLLGGTGATLLEILGIKFPGTESKKSTGNHNSTLYSSHTENQHRYWHALALPTLY